jgi:hypothetical protein
MMSAATVGILITANDQATPVIKGLSNTLVSQKMNLRELSMGMREVGAGVLGLGLALKSLNIPAAQTASNILMFVGGLMTAVAAIPQFIRGVTLLINAVKALMAAQIMQQAFAGPAGWAMLAGGVAVAAGAGYAVNRGMNKTSASAAPPIVIENKTYLDGQQIGAATRKQTILTQGRNGTVTQK